MSKPIRLLSAFCSLCLLLPCIALFSCRSQTDDSADQSSTLSGSEDPATTTSPDDSGNSNDPNANLPLPASIEVGKLRVQLLSDRMVRIEVKGPKGFEDRPSYTVVKRRGFPDVDYTAAEEGDYNVITTSAYKIYLPKDAKTPAGSYITSPDGTVLWTYESNTDSNVYLPSPSDELNSWYFTDAPRVIPSENGYSPSNERNNGWDLSNDATDLFVFLPQGSYENFTSDFISLTGSSEMITLNMLGYWDSRWYAYTTETALQQIQDYLDRGYSIDVLVIDTDWRTTENGVGYNINKQLFPNMAEFLEKAHEMGVSIVFNDHPEPVSGTSSLLDQKEVEYRNNNLKLILSLGLDYWWYDRNWSVALNPIKDGISIYASGMYAFQWITEDYYNSITDVNEYARRALIMGNVDGILNGVLEYAPEISAHKFSIQWTGDIESLPEDLEDEIFNAVYGGAELGLPYVSADIGGHRFEVSDDMYVRWMQFGALSPICRVHCTKPLSRMPWLYGKTAEEVTHQYVDMRYRLLPLYYALAHENYETGLPLLRRLDIAYPQYAESSANDEYLLGQTILVAPLTDSYGAVSDFILTSNGQPGLLGEYYTNKSLSGDPAFTRQDESIYFDWGQGAPDGLSVSDNFSIRWSGEITIGSEDTILRFLADDGLKVWIDDKLVANGWTVYDQQFSTDPLKAGSTHTIKIEYFDATSYAHFYLTAVSNKGVSRDVFLPDGEWMDVWTGERIVGPTTITVTHGLETSPIFVRMGAVIPLADNMSNTGEKDWSHLTLDVYPSADKDASTVLYEDDTKTVAYKDGQYRTTNISLIPNSEKQGLITLQIEAAKGNFEGALAFTERSWTIRLHGRSDWGELTKLLVNGKAVEWTVLEQDAEGDPFANQGGALDGIIYEITFSASVTQACTLEIEFSSAQTYPDNPGYDKTAAEFTVDIEKITKSEGDVNLTAYGNKDWAIFGAIDVNTTFRKQTENHLIGTPVSIDEPFGFTDNYTISWSDGAERSTGFTTNGMVSKHSFNLTLKVSPETTCYKLYLGGYQSVAKLTVRDRAGNVKTFTFGDLKTNYYRIITLACTSDAESELYISYSLLSGNNITLAAVAASDGTVVDVEPIDPTPADSGISVVTPFTGTFDLTAEGIVDWEYYGKVNNTDNTTEQRKANAADRIETVFDSSQTHDDNKAVVKWSDGAQLNSAETRHGINTSNSITVKLNVENCTQVKLLPGCWNATNMMVLYDEKGTALESVKLLSAGSSAQLALVTIDLSKYDVSELTVKFTCTSSNGGNVSLAAVTLG